MAHDSKKGDTFNVSSHNQTGGITAGQVHFGPPQRRVDARCAAWLLQTLPLDGPAVELAATTGDPETFFFAQEIEAFLRANGYNVRGIGQFNSMPPVFGLQLDPHSEWTKLLVGHRG